MSDIPEVFTAEYYDQGYFKTPKGKKFRRANGSEDAWSYANPEGEFLGAKEIAEAWKKVFNPKNMLDVGAGRGTVIAYARDVGIEAEGFDFSEWAVNEGRYRRCKTEWLKVHDATNAWPYPSKSFDLVTALDFYEHIYIGDLPFVIEEMYRVAKKWIFLEIATVGGGSGPIGRIREEGYILNRGEPVPIEREGNAVAGHVTVCSEDWWYERFEHEDWMSRRDMVNWFFSLVDLKIVKNWALNTVIVLEKL